MGQLCVARTAYMEISSMILRQVALELIPAPSQTTAQTSDTDVTTTIRVLRRDMGNGGSWESTLREVLMDLCLRRLLPLHVILFFSSEETFILLILFLLLLLRRGKSRDYVGRS